MYLNISLNVNKNQRLVKVMGKIRINWPLFTTGDQIDYAIFKLKIILILTFMSLWECKYIILNVEYNYHMWMLVGNPISYTYSDYIYVTVTFINLSRYTYSMVEVILNYVFTVLTSCPPPPSNSIPFLTSIHYLHLYTSVPTTFFCTEF